MVSSVPPLLSPLNRVSNVPTATRSVGADLGLPAFYFVAGEMFSTSFLNHFPLGFLGASGEGRTTVPTQSCARAVGNGSVPRLGPAEGHSHPDEPREEKGWKGGSREREQERRRSMPVVLIFHCLYTIARIMEIETEGEKKAPLVLRRSKDHALTYLSARTGLGQGCGQGLQGQSRGPGPGPPPGSQPRCR